MLLLTQSTPLIFMGDEFGNSQQGNNNPYCQDNKITWLNWQDREKKAELLNFWKQMIAFRKAHPILHPVEELRILDSLSCGYPDLSYHGQNAWRPQTESYNRHVGIMYCRKVCKDTTGWGGFFPLCCHEYALGAAETGISKAAEGYGMESCAGNGEGGRYSDSAGERRTVQRADGDHCPQKYCSI